MRHSLRLSLAAFLILNGCCDHDTKRIQSHWLRAGEGYYLRLLSVSAAQSPISITRTEFTASDFQTVGLDGEIRVQEYGFWLDLTNKGGESLRVLWPEARYVDEMGTEHTVYAQQRGALPDERDKLPPPAVELIEAGARSRPTVVPIYKQYLVAGGCRDLYPYSEPLVPTRLDDKNEQQMKKYVDDLAKRQVPVKLILPIENGGKHSDYTFTFVLKDRKADLPKQ